MGSLFGSYLLKNGNDVMVLGRNLETIDLVNKNGLTIYGPTEELKVKIPMSADPKLIEDADLIILCVKSMNTRDVMEVIAPYIKQDCYLLTLQNGLGNGDIIAEYMAEDRIIVGVTAEGANTVKPAAVRHAGHGDTFIGMMDASRPSIITTVRNTLRGAGFHTEISDNVEALLWGKLLVNAGINAVTAILGLKNGEILNHPHALSILTRAVREAENVAKKKGVTLYMNDPVSYTLRIAQNTAKNRSSMLQDITRKRPTEIDFINGAIVREGRKLAVDVSTNETLFNMVKCIEAVQKKGNE